MLLLFARAELRRRWRAHAGFAVVVTIAVAAVVATLSAAGRAEDAFHELRSVTEAADVAIFSDPASTARNAEAAAASPGVEHVSTEAEMFVRPAGRDDLYPDYNIYSRAPLRIRDARRVNVPVIVEGRAVNPRRSGEVALSEGLARELGLTVGDRLTLESVTDAWVDVAYSGGDPGPPDGPTVQTRVVGLARTPADFGHWIGLIHLSPAFAARYGDEMRTYRRIEAQVPAAADRRGIRGLTDDAEVSPSVFGDDAATADGLATIAAALRISAVVAALAGGVVVAFALSRLTRLTLRDRRTLTALGWTRRQAVLATFVVLGPWLVLGTALGVVVGAILAPEALVGLAGAIDPTRGAIWIDAVVYVGVVLGALTLCVVVMAAAAGRTRPPDTVGRRVSAQVLPLDRPLPVVLGVRRAVAGEPRLGGRTSRAAIAVLAVGLAGAVAALVVSASIGRLQTDPRLVGQGTGRLIDSGESTEVYDMALVRLTADPRVAMLAGLNVGFGVSAGDRGVTVLAYDRRKGALEASMVEGRVARGRTEVALGPATLDALGKHVGDRVRLRGPEGSATYRIVGETLFPEGDFQYDDGAAMTSAAAARVLGDVHDVEGIHQVVFDWAQGVDVAAADRGLARAGLIVQTNDNALKPARVTNLGQVETLPRYLAGFLGVLALATFGHAVTLSSRRRTREMATLRALGFTGRAGAAVVGAQALTIVGLAVVAGVPAGLLLGDRVWTSIAQNANVVVATVAPADAITAFVGASIVIAGLLAMIPAWRTLRLRPSHELRAE